MRAVTPATPGAERDELRALIEQQTKAFEAKNGAVKTLDIVKKTDDGNIWNDRKTQPKAKRNTAPSKPAPAPAPAPKPIEPTHHNAIRANQSAEKVGELLDEGKSVKEIAAALQRPERSIRYYRSRLMAINKSADAIEKTLNSIEARTK